MANEEVFVDRVINRTNSGDILDDGSGVLDDITFDDESVDDGEPPNDREPPGGGGPPDDGEPPDDDSELPYIDPSDIQDPTARGFAERLYNSIRDHLTPNDLQGAWRDVHNDPVPNPNTGGYYDHLKEVTDAMRSIRNAINAFKDLLDNLDLSGSDRGIIEILLSRGSKTLDYVEKVIYRDQWFPGTHIPFS